MVTTMMKTNLKIMLHALFFMLLAFMTSSPVFSDEHITYVHFDALGSSIAGSDSTGSLVWSEEYQPYGDRIVSDNSTGNNLWYTGKASYENFGLSYFGARWYNPVLGRFTGIDPVKYQEDNIHSFNRYAYANNNPYKFVDPDGRAAFLYPIVVFILKEAGGEVLEQTTGAQLPTVKNIGQAVFKTAVKKGVTKKANPLDGTKFTDKVKRQMNGKDTDHNFPSSIDKQADAASVKKITGGDGIGRTKVELPGNINGKDGNFSWIIEPDKTVNHRQFERLKKK